MRHLILPFLVFGLSACSDKPTILRKHFLNNYELYEQLKYEVQNEESGWINLGQLTKPQDHNEQVNKLIQQLPMKVNYLFSQINICDTITTLQFELIFESNIQLNHSECQLEMDSTNSNINVLELNENWVIWWENDFI